MLKSLYVKDFAIIDEISIDFDRGFNVFTGETGAGKSIIIGALSYLIKGKADPSVIRSGAEKAIIEGVFSIDDSMKPLLEEADIDYDDDLIVRRTMSKDMRNTIRINQCSVTLNFLSELFEDHIDIHSQKDSQYLLNKKNHLHLLDEYSANEDKRNEYKVLYREYNQAFSEYENLKNNTYNDSDLEYYRFDLNELEVLNPDMEEEKDLEQQEKYYKSSEKYLLSLSSAIDLAQSDAGIQEKMYQLSKELNLDDDEILKIKENIDSLYYSFNDEIEHLQKILDRFSKEDIDIEKIEERLYQYSKLKRKHNTDTEGLIRKKKELEEKIRFFEDRDFVLAEKKKNVDNLYLQAKQIAEKISEERKLKAKQLEEKIIDECDDLMLKNAVFKIVFNESTLNANGIDDVEFYISLNKGEELKPLKNVASGGEISRLMLALKTVFTSLSNTSLVIFDEIDTGVSGKTGLAIGQKMAQIARSTQVLSITHLASVAACGDSHYYIYKVDDQSHSETKIRKLKGEEIINELAFISSSDNSINALNAARELYSTAQNSVKNEN